MDSLKIVQFCVRFKADIWNAILVQNATHELICNKVREVEYLCFTVLNVYKKSR